MNKKDKEETNKELLNYVKKDIRHKNHLTINSTKNSLHSMKVTSKKRLILLFLTHILALLNLGTH